MTSLYRRVETWVASHQLEIAVFLFALVVRLFVIWLAKRELIFGHDLGADGSDYVNEADNLRNGHGFSRAYEPPYIADTLRTPLYPLWLAGIRLAFGSYVPVMFIEALLSSLLPVIGVRMAQLFIRDWRLVLGVGLFLSVQLDYVFNTIFFGSEGLSVLLLSWGLYEIVLVARGAHPYRSALWAGLALGLATLVRPITYLLPLFLLPLFAYIGFVKKTMPQILKALGVFTAIFVLVLSPWMVRNYVTFGHAGFDTIGWFQVYTRLGATVIAMDRGNDFITSFHTVLDDLSTRGYIAHPPPVSELEIEDPRFMPVLRTESLRIFSEHKRALALFLLNEPFAVLTQDNTLALMARLGFQYDQPPQGFAATVYASSHGVFATFAVVAPYLASAFVVHYVMRAFWLVLALFTAGGAWVLWRRGERFAALFFVGFIAYIILFSVSAGAMLDARYRVQFLMLEIILTGVALEKLLPVLNRKRIQLLRLPR